MGLQGRRPGFISITTGGVGIKNRRVGIKLPSVIAAADTFASL